MAPGSQPPRSVTSFGLNLIGALAALVAFYVLRERHLSGPAAVLAVCAAGVVPIVLVDLRVLRVHRRASTGLDWDKPATPDLARCVTKLVGLAVTVAPLALAYWVFPEYGSWYGAFWDLLRRFGLALVI